MPMLKGTDTSFLEVVHLDDSCKGLPTTYRRSMVTVAALQIWTCVFLQQKSSCVWADVGQFVSEKAYLGKALGLKTC